MKIFIPRSSSSKGCDPFSCDIYNFDKLSTGRKKKKSSPSCGRYWCGQVTTSGEEK